MNHDWLAWLAWYVELKMKTWSARKQVEIEKMKWKSHVFCHFYRFGVYFYCYTVIYNKYQHLREVVLDVDIYRK